MEISQLRKRNENYNSITRNVKASRSVYYQNNFKFSAPFNDFVLRHSWVFMVIIWMRSSSELSRVQPIVSVGWLNWFSSSCFIKHTVYMYHAMWIYQRTVESKFQLLNSFLTSYIVQQLLSSDWVKYRGLELIRN